jgi:glycosyltransferase involved in cell wall biosynthesis
MAAPFLDDPILEGVTVVHLVRHPFDFIQSHIRMCNWDGRYAGFNQWTYQHAPGLEDIADPICRSARLYVQWNAMIEPHADVFHRIEDDVRFLLDKLGIDWQGKELFSDTRYNHRQVNDEVFGLAEARQLPREYRLPLYEMLERYGYDARGGVAVPMEYIASTSTDSISTSTDSTSTPVIKAIICTMDNLPNNIDQLSVLRADPLISEIIVVDQDSKDGTAEWLDAQEDITVIHRTTGPNGAGRGAGPGRNAGLDAAGEFDYVLMLDGGIRPLRGGTQRMLDWLEAHPEADAIATDWHYLETDKEQADRRWAEPIEKAFRQWTLSETHYGLFRARAWGGFRFAEFYPFGWAGWGADDDEMMHRWHDADPPIQVWITSEVHPYRRGSGSFRRLFKETGIWPNQYGSNYEERCVWLTQEQPHHGKSQQWGEPWLTVVVRAGPDAASLIKRSHDELRKRRLDKPWAAVWNPYSVVLWDAGRELEDWAEPRRLRQHHGNTIIVDKTIVRRNAENADTWTGDFRYWVSEDWEAAIRPGAFYYGLVGDMDGLIELLRRYNESHPRQPLGGMNREYRPKERARLY